MAGRQGFEPRSDGPEPPVLPLDDLPALGVIVEKRLARFKTKGNRERQNRHFLLGFASFFHNLLSLPCIAQSGLFNQESGIRNQESIISPPVCTASP